MLQRGTYRNTDDGWGINGHCGLAACPSGLILACTAPGHILEQRLINRILGAIINVGRSIPFIILMVAVIPFTRFVVGTSIGTTAAIVPLSIAATPS